MCKEIKNTDDRCTNEKVQGFHVVAVTNRTLSKRPYLEQIRKICEWGPDAIILREKDLTEKEYKDLAESAKSIRFHVFYIHSIKWRWNCRVTAFICHCHCYGK